MTTFQAIIYSLVHGFTQFLPVGQYAHQILVPYVLGWSEPQGVLLGAFHLGALLSLLIYFRHDWASIISSFLQVVIFRKKPMTLDERLPIFLTITVLPLATASYYFRETLQQQFSNSILWTILSLAFFGIPLWFSDSFSRKTKGMFDWNWLDSLMVGIGLSFSMIPGCGQTTGALMGGMFRNYNREAAAKYTFFALAPILFAQTVGHFRGFDLHSIGGTADVSWLSFGVSVVVTTIAGLLAIGGFMKQNQNRSFFSYALYRFIVAAGVGVVYWLRSRA